MVAAVARTAPRDATVVFDVDRAQKELAFGTALHLSLWHGRGDVRVAVPGVTPVPAAAGLVLTNRERLSEAARPFARPGPAEIEELAEVRLWSAYHLPRSAACAVRDGRWPGLPREAKSWRWPDFRGAADPPGRR